MTPLSKEAIEALLDYAKSADLVNSIPVVNLCTELLAARESLKDLSFHEDALAHRAVQISRLQRALKVAELGLKFYGNSMSYSLDTYLGISGEMMHRCVLYGDSTEINDVSSHAGRRAREALTEIAKIRGEK